MRVFLVVTDFFCKISLLMLLRMFLGCGFWIQKAAVLLLK